MTNMRSPRPSDQHRLGGLIVFISSYEPALRLVLLLLALSSIVVLAALRLAWFISEKDQQEMSLRKESSLAGIARQPIYDRKGRTIAADVLTYGLAFDPIIFRRAGQDPVALADDLVQIVPRLNKKTLITKLQTRDKLFLLERRIVPSQKSQLVRLGIAGMRLVKERARMYTYGSLFAPLVGYTDVDNRGLAGIEKGYDAQLRAPGDGLTLTLDARYQIVMEGLLQEAQTRTSAKAAIGIILDTRRGDTLAMVSLPSGNPHQPASWQAHERFNYAAQRYEMGSTFKIFNTALALESGIDLQARFDVRSSLRVAEFEVSDHHTPKRYLTTAEVLIHSSNTGSAQIALKIGWNKQKAFLASLGLLDPTGLHLPELSVPQYPYVWRNPELVTISFGHGIAVTPLHLSAAVAAVVNGGIYNPPRIMLEDGSSHNLARRVVSPQTSAIMRELLWRVVKEGTGRRANEEGLLIGGKTGTAEKIAPGGGYSKHHLLSSFIGVYPVEKPRIVVLVMLDEPRSATGVPLSGGASSASVVGDVIRALAPLVMIEDNPVSPEDSQPDDIEYTLADQ